MSTHIAKAVSSNIIIFRTFCIVDVILYQNGGYYISKFDLFDILMYANILKEQQFLNKEM